LLLEFVDEGGTALLEELAVRVVVFHGDAVLLHDVVVHQAGGTGKSEATSIGHTEALGHDDILLIH